MSDLVLSLFPGIGLLDMAFEEEGFCVVRGPDLLWGGDVHRFHPPAEVFDGVIGGSPCQRFSRLANIVKAVHGEDSLAPNLIPEFERVVAEAAPRWFLMENVPAAPLPVVEGYEVADLLLNNRWCGGVQNRVRRFSFGTPEGASLDVPGEALEPATWEPAVCSTAGGRRASVAIGGSGKPKGNQGKHPSARLKKRSLAEQCELQGLPADFLENAPFTRSGKEKAVGNGVPLPMGRAIAEAVKRALVALAAVFLLALPLSAEALTTPAPFPECLQREVLPDLRSAGAELWELQAFDAITRGGQSKRPADVIAHGCEIVLGSAHFPAGRLGAYEPPALASYCESWDTEARWRALAWLYSDASGAIQLRVWRRGIAPALTAAREAGWESDRDLALMGAVANTSPSLFRRLLAECEGDRDCVASEYGSGSAHRERRIQWLRRER